MEKTHYGPFKFRDILIKKCSDCGHPLDPAQVSQLEETLDSFSTFHSGRTIDNISYQERLALLSKQELDFNLITALEKRMGYKYGVKARICSTIDNYRKMKDRKCPIDAPYTDADALSLYKYGISIINAFGAKDPFKYANQLYKIKKPRGFSFIQFELLHYYLTERGIITEENPLYTRPQYNPQVIEKPISDFKNISPKTRCELERLGIRTLKDLADKNVNEPEALKKLGKDVEREACNLLRAQSCVLRKMYHEI